MKEVAGIMSALNISLLKLFFMGFIGRRLMLMQKIWSVSVMVVKKFQDELMCQLKN